MPHLKLLHTAEWISVHKAWRPQMVGAGSIVRPLLPEQMEQYGPSPVTGDYSEPMVVIVDTAGREATGWLATTTYFEEVSSKKALIRTVPDPTELSWVDRLRGVLMTWGRGATLSEWLEDLITPRPFDHDNPIKQHRALFAEVVRNLGGSVPSDDISLVKAVHRLVLHRELNMASKTASKNGKKGAAAKSAKKSGRSRKQEAAEEEEDQATAEQELEQDEEFEEEAEEDLEEEEAGDDEAAEEEAEEEAAPKAKKGKKGKGGKKAKGAKKAKAEGPVGKEKLAVHLVKILGQAKAKDALVLAKQLQTAGDLRAKEWTKLRDGVNSAATAMREKDNAELARELSSTNRLIRRYARAAAKK